MKLNDTSVLVTGASRGLGAALAKRLAAAGARLVLVARDEEPLKSLAREIRDQGGEAHAVPADLGDKHAILPLAAAAAELAGPIDVVIHNASTLGPVPLKLLLDTACEELERVLAVNLVGPFRLTKALAGSMALRGRGLVVHITSDASVEAYPRWGAYSVSKAAFDHLARLWAAELDELGIRVLSIDPGEMDTRMHADAVPGADPNELADPRDVAAKILALLGRVEEIPNGVRLAAEVRP